MVHAWGAMISVALLNFFREREEGERGANGEAHKAEKRIERKIYM